MSKFNLKTLRRTKVRSPITSETQPAGRTFEGGSGYARDAKSELFLLAVTNMVGEHTFYESARTATAGSPSSSTRSAVGPGVDRPPDRVAAPRRASAFGVDGRRRRVRPGPAGRRSARRQPRGHRLGAAAGRRARRDPRLLDSRHGRVDPEAGQARRRRCRRPPVLGTLTAEVRLRRQGLPLRRRPRPDPRRRRRRRGRATCSGTRSTAGTTARTRSRTGLRIAHGTGGAGGAPAEDRRAVLRTAGAAVGGRA